MTRQTQRDPKSDSDASLVGRMRVLQPSRSSRIIAGKQHDPAENPLFSD